MGAALPAGLWGLPGAASPALPAPLDALCVCFGSRYFPERRRGDAGDERSSGAHAGVGIAQIIRKRVAEPLIYLSERFPFPCVSICGARRCVDGVGKGPAVPRCL